MIVIGLVTGFLGWNLQRLTFDFEFEKLFPTDDPDSKLYEYHKEEFGYDNNFLFLTLENPSGIFDQIFLQKVKAFEEEISQLKYVERILSPVSQKHIINSPAGVLPLPLMHIDDSDLLKGDSIRIFKNEFYSASFGKDGKSLGIYVTHSHFQDPDESNALVSSIEKLAIDSGLPNVRVVGKLKAQNVFIAFIQDDFGKFLIGSILLSFILLLIIFRSLISAILPFLISVISIVWLFGFMGFLGVQINLLSSLLPPILFFVAMSDAVHLMNAIGKVQSPDEPLKEAVKIVWKPTLLTSITTAIGFLSLIWINTQPVQFLGVFAAIGVLIAFTVTFSLGLILALYLSSNAKEVRLNVPQSFLAYLLKHRVVVSISAFILLIFIIPGISKLKVNAYLLDDLPEQNQVRKDFEFVDQFYGGSKPYELRIEIKEGTVWDKVNMDELYKIEKYLVDDFLVGRVQSPITLIKYANQANNGGLNQFYKYPESVRAYNRARNLLRRNKPADLRKLLAPDEKVCRMVGFLPELGSLETNRRNEKLILFLEENIDHSKISYHITGTTFLIDKSHELLSENLIKGILTAVLIIGIILGLYFKSFKLLLISLIPNLIPLLLVAGILGWMSIDLKMTTSIIFTIVFGIAVDDTIHMMSYYLQDKTQDRRKALQNTLTHAGSAMLITSVIVIAGFSLFLLSSFGATYYLGLFISLSLLLALVVDLTLLPILLLLIKKTQD